MAATYNDTELNYLADQEAARITHLSMHTADPGKTGANEATGGGYVRQPVTFNAAGTAGPLGVSLQPATVGKAWSSEATFDLAANTYTHAGGWTAATAGAFRGGNILTANQVLSLDGQVKCSVCVGPVLGG